MKRTRLSQKKCHAKVRLKYGSVPDSKFIKKQLAMGVLVEMEHTDCPKLAKQIAKAHLTEEKHYYTTLLKAGL
jgi:hypothetical protein